MENNFRNFTTEVNMVVKDSIKAKDLYVQVFGAKELNSTNLDTGTNESLIKIGELQVHLLDENPEYMMFAPKDGEHKTMWLNQIVDDIEKKINLAEKNGFKIISPVNTISEMKIKNTVLECPFGYIWILHELI